MSSKKLKFVQRYAHTVLERPFNAGVEYPNQSKIIDIGPSRSTVIAVAIAIALSGFIPLGLTEPIKLSGCANYPQSCGYWG
jgi:hypothetical protein